MRMLQGSYHTSFLSKGTIDMDQRENSSYIFLEAGKKNATDRLMSHPIIPGNLPISPSMSGQRAKMILLVQQPSSEKK